MIMISIAAGVAVNNKYRTIGIGVHAGDHFVYPDCRPRFISGMNMVIADGNDGFHGFDTTEEMVGVRGYYHTHAVVAPFLEKTKADIAYRALELGVPLHMTWSCYKGGDKHCGRCGTCVERLEAIDEAAKRRGLLAKHIDQTEYEDSEYWKTAVRNGG
jgi:7-cyano-7-deazaguanine synthase